MQTLVENHLRKSALATPNSILVATDLTDADYLAPHAIAQAKACGAQVTLLHALPPSDVVPMDGSVIPYVDRTKIVRDARVALLAVSRQFEAQGVNCDTIVREGVPREIIPDEIDRTGATRLIVGTHGRGKLGQLALGSVARDLITNVNVPVFVVGPHARTGIRHTTPQSILLPVSLAGAYRSSLNLAFGIAQANRAELTLLHVLDQEQNPATDPERTIEWAESALRALLPDASTLNTPVHIVVTSGRPAEEILKTAERISAHLIILGADGGTHIWPFNEDAAYRVMTAAACPVLTLRHEPVLSKPANLEEVHFTSPL